MSVVPLHPEGHAVWELAPDLLLVHKPAGHREDPHTHPYALRLRVLRGRLLLEAEPHAMVLTAGETTTVAANASHATIATAVTWLVAERLPGGA
jgi:quercetin dioxygenase-like cupin family protein